MAASKPQLVPLHNPKYDGVDGRCAPFLCPYARKDGTRCEKGVRSPFGCAAHRAHNERAFELKEEPAPALVVTRVAPALSAAPAMTPAECEKVKAAANALIAAAIAFVAAIEGGARTILHNEVSADGVATITAKIV